MSTKGSYKKVVTTVEKRERSVDPALVLDLLRLHFNDIPPDAKVELGIRGHGLDANDWDLTEFQLDLRWETCDKKVDEETIWDPDYKGLPT